MPDNEKSLYALMIKGYQNKLAGAEFELLRERALSELKDQRIQALEAERAPKPGPR
jgi:hypothetical protein